MFGTAVYIDSFESEQNIQKKRASYKDIQKWVRDNYNECVTNLDISRTKKSCGLAQNEYKGRKASKDYYVPKVREHKQKMVVEALKHFNLIS